MAKIKSKVLSFPASPSTDVTDYRLYYTPSTAALDYGSPNAPIGLVTSVDLANFNGLVDAEGMFDLGITAVDVAGNESDMTMINDVPLDFTPPLPVGPITIS